MDDIYIYYVDFPDSVKEVVTPCLDGYTIYINSKLPREAMIQAYKHAMRHICHSDFNNDNVQDIEARAHI